SALRCARRATRRRSACCTCCRRRPGHGRTGRRTPAARALEEPHEQGAGDEQHDTGDAARRGRSFREADQAEAVDQHAHHELGGDEDAEERRGADPHRHDHRRRDVERAEQAADPRPPRRVPRVDPAGAVEEQHDDEQRDRADAERHHRRAHRSADVVREPRVDACLYRQEHARDYGEQNEEDAGHPATTGFDSTPIPSISTSTVSPGFIVSFGSRAYPTPAGVPVRIRSPGSSVNTFETNDTRWGTLKMRSRVFPSWITSPFSRCTTRRPPPSPSSATGTHVSPSGQNVSKPFARVHWLSECWMSRAETSFAQR